MILDTTYFLPLVGIEVDVDLLRACIEGRARLSLDEVKLSLISIFELQAKAAKLGIPAERVITAIDAILDGFEVVSFYEQDVVRISHSLRRMLPDYIDCVILATAIALGEDIATEDEMISEVRDKIEALHRIRVRGYGDLVGPDRERVDQKRLWRRDLFTRA